MKHIKICPYCGEKMTLVGVEDYNGYWECFDCGCCLEPSYSSEDIEEDWVADTYWWG